MWVVPEAAKCMLILTTAGVTNPNGYWEKLCIYREGIIRLFSYQEYYFPKIIFQSITYASVWVLICMLLKKVNHLKIRCNCFKGMAQDVVRTSEQENA